MPGPINNSPLASISNPSFEHAWREFSAYGVLPTGSPVMQLPGAVTYADAELEPGMIGYSRGASAPQYTAILGQGEVDAAAARQATTVGIAAALLLGAGLWFYLRR